METTQRKASWGGNQINKPLVGQLLLLALAGGSWSLRVYACSSGQQQILLISALWNHISLPKADPLSFQRNGS
jgi:hypothetical protein